MPAHMINYQFHISKKLDMIKLAIENIYNKNWNNQTHTINKEEYDHNYTTDYCSVPTVKTEDTLYSLYYLHKK
jgi:hypothetical protein